jgi:hypothetical protein
LIAFFKTTKRIGFHQMKYVFHGFAKHTVSHRT